ncbi:INTS9 [Bugula neritina]|uniref:INTS9 n=1 Tax=Bugula neritina TaxID=10212 RepID=A0A7J7KSL1_BUGNE|nr:INTS9 [Bugula neritina]
MMIQIIIMILLFKEDLQRFADTIENCNYIMRLFSLSDETNQPCYVLKFKDTHIMLDCGMDLNSLLNFMPIFNIKSKESSQYGNVVVHANNSLDNAIPCNIKEVNRRFFFDSEPMVSTPEIDAINLNNLDAIIVSNYLSILALPFVTEGTGFKGTIYATDPTVQTGRHLMEELIKYLGEAETCHDSLRLLDDNISGVPAELLTALSTNHRWRQIYTQENVNSCLSRVHTVAYNEKNSIFGLLNIMAISSGYCIGSCNWIIDSDHERITYIAGSCALTTHPRKSDVMIITNLNRSPTQNPDAMISEFTTATVETLKKGGNVLVPCLPCGVTFDMFECLANHLKLSNLHTYQCISYQSEQKPVWLTPTSTPSG